MEAMCDWCGQVVPIDLDGSCFLGHPVSAAAQPVAPVDLDVATPPPTPLDTVASIPEFTAVASPPLPAPPMPADMGPVPPALPPQPPVFAGSAPAPAAPQPPHAPIVPPPLPAPPVPVGAGAPLGSGLPGAPMSPNPVDAAFAPLTGASASAAAPPLMTPQAYAPSPPQPFAPVPATPQQHEHAGPALPPQAPTGPGWQAVHLADDVAVFEYRPPGAAAPTDDVIAQLPPPAVPAAASAPEGLSAADVAAFAPNDELGIPESGSKTRQILLLAVLAIVALGAAVAFALGLI